MTIRLQKKINASHHHQPPTTVTNRCYTPRPREYTADMDGELVRWCAPGGVAGDAGEHGRGAAGGPAAGLALALLAPRDDDGEQLQGRRPTPPPLFSAVCRRAGRLSCTRVPIAASARGTRVDRLLRTLFLLRGSTPASPDALRIQSQPLETSTSHPLRNTTHLRSMTKRNEKTKRLLSRQRNEESRKNNDMVPCEIDTSLIDVDSYTHYCTCINVSGTSRDSAILLVR
jgi:hypothetical protein